MSSRLTFCAVFLLAIGSSVLAFGQAQQRAAQNDTDEGPRRGAVYADLVRADGPVAYWRFEDEGAAGELNGSPWPAKEVSGGVMRMQEGPGAKKFSLFEAGNKGVSFSKPGSLRYDDPGANSPVDFAVGERITIEAWVNPTKIGSGQKIYVVGKGRTGNKGFAADNHNWSLRLTGKDGSCRVSFLFRDADNRRGVQDDWHDWMSDAGFSAGSGWHYVAVSYEFGKGDSIRGYVDGKATKGTWDYGGKTDEGPVVDDDQVWIGSGNGNNAGNSFIGGIDEVAIYRTALTAKQIAARWKVVEPKAYVTNVEIPAGAVLVEVLEGMKDEWSWDFVPPQPSERFLQRDLAFVEAPRKYTNHGVIDDRSSPFVMWAHARVNLPAGKYRVLLRSRGSARLFVGDKLVVQTPFQTNKTDGHSPYKPVESRISKNIRALQPGDSEEVAEVEFAGGEQQLAARSTCGREEAPAGVGGDERGDCAGGE